ncbi:hypothetical protein AGABI1DRAFT_129710 [Agaricus bisporus var. burnettii JB137-S8]|uniref:Major facilitator superfamily (MFS) profile domain-containing protein n=1 Tax=Agaricus bisporus var. burnettii (strain JB137-S8 / ATCC MYA-4627 / FGSC 10392) TaxID=597362 RepID=K5XSI4_AGABU|nr:uncharacterized protein AGABI1DRAFT_129710 [Agaricus bisporus var. burnettii JB137-S8]EKM77920.1 hypothetical protein AGABI1DRAFT_129710 [Agaricus bisporus var. burnettii JB137-S8]
MALPTKGPPEDKEFSALPTARKIILLIILCLAQFLDTFAISALFAAIPQISVQLGISDGDSVWLISGYQLTFASLMLGGGRLSDLYNPKYNFLAGAAILAVFSLAGGFVRKQIPLFILRALMGIGAAVNVPSALYIIIHLFPDPTSQANAVALFGICGALGNVIGLVIGAFIVNWATWPWIFYMFAIFGAVLFTGVLILCPSPKGAPLSALDKAKRFKRLDMIGVFLMAVGLILFIFGVTSGSTTGWDSARCLAPFLISFIFLIGFFFWEARIPEEMAAIPPSLWRVDNFAIIAGCATMPIMWWATVQLLYSWIWQNVYGWSPIMTAVRFLPLGVLGFIMSPLTTSLQQRFSNKWILLVGHLLVIIGTALFPFGDSPQHYWRFVFVGFCIGTTGVLIVYTIVSIDIFAVTSPEQAGVVGSIFNCFLQLGSAAGSAIATSIQTSVDKTHGGPTSWTGRKAAFWFLFALLVIETVCVFVFMHDTLPRPKPRIEEELTDIPEKEHTDKLEKA